MPKDKILLVTFPLYPNIVFFLQYSLAKRVKKRKTRRGRKKNRKYFKKVAPEPICETVTSTDEKPASSVPKDDEEDLLVIIKKKNNGTVLKVDILYISTF